MRRPWLLVSAALIAWLAATSSLTRAELTLLVLIHAVDLVVEHVAKFEFDPLHLKSLDEVEPVASVLSLVWIAPLLVHVTFHYVLPFLLSYAPAPFSSTATPWIVRFVINVVLAPRLFDATQPRFKYYASIAWNLLVNTILLVLYSTRTGFHEGITMILISSLATAMFSRVWPEKAKETDVHED